MLLEDAGVDVDMKLARAQDNDDDEDDDDIDDGNGDAFVDHVFFLCIFTQQHTHVA